MKYSFFIIIGITVVSVLLALAFIPLLSMHVLSSENYLNLVNEDRKKHNLSILVLGSNNAAQSKADDMLQNNYFSHRNMDGIQSYVEYTKNGGKGFVSENLAMKNFQCVVFCWNINIDKRIKELQESFMSYNGGNNPHRNTILDPYNTHVNFGVSYDGKQLYFVQHFERNLIQWKNVSLDSNGDLRMHGSIPTGFVLEDILIYTDSALLSLSPDKLNTNSSDMSDTYGFGVLSGIILPDVYHDNEKCPEGLINPFKDELCLPYTHYKNNGNHNNIIDLSTNVSKWLEQDGVHTIHVRLFDLEKTKTIEVTSLDLTNLN